MFFKILGNGEPSRLLVAGIHGNEGAITCPIVKLFTSYIKIMHGRLIICCLPEEQTYITTLDEAYLNSRNGKKLLSLIHKYNPSIYIELHSYDSKNYSKLIDFDRKKKLGVPPLIELENKVLIGSVSPYIRITEFKTDDFCFMIEVPAPLSVGTIYITLDVLEIIALSNSREEIMRDIGKIYPNQISVHEMNFHEFFKFIRK